MMAWRKNFVVGLLVMSLVSSAWGEALRLVFVGDVMLDDGPGRTVAAGGDPLAPFAAELRNAGIRAEVYLGNPKNFGNQLKYADKRASPVAIIQGGDEALRGVVQIKDLILGAKLASEVSHEEWKSQPAQTEVARGDLVQAVREMLARW